MLKIIVLWMGFLPIFLMGKDYALIVSIAQYKSRALTNLNVASDVDRYTEILQRFGVRNIDYLHNKEATKEHILAWLRRSAKDIKKRDRFFMFFTGHGTDKSDVLFAPKLKKALAGKVNLNETGVLFPYDFNSHRKKIAESVIIGRRDLKKSFQKIDNITKKAFVVFDACFSKNSVKGNLFKRKIKYLHLYTEKKTYPYKNIVYIGASKAQAQEGKLSRTLSDCLKKGTTFVALKSCMNSKLKKSPQKAVVRSFSESPAIFWK